MNAKPSAERPVDATRPYLPRLGRHAVGEHTRVVRTCLAWRFAAWVVAAMCVCAVPGLALAQTAPSDAASEQALIEALAEWTWGTTFRSVRRAARLTAAASTSRTPAALWSRAWCASERGDLELARAELDACRAANPMYGPCIALWATAATTTDPQRIDTVRTLLRRANVDAGVESAVFFVLQAITDEALRRVVANEVEAAHPESLTVAVLAGRRARERRDTAGVIAAYGRVYSTRNALHTTAHDDLIRYFLVERSDGTARDRANELIVFWNGLLVDGPGTCQLGWAKYELGYAASLLATALGEQLRQRSDAEQFAMIAHRVSPTPETVYGLAAPLMSAQRGGDLHRAVRSLEVPLFLGDPLLAHLRAYVTAYVDRDLPSAILQWRALVEERLETSDVETMLRRVASELKAVGGPDDLRVVAAVAERRAADVLALTLRRDAALFAGDVTEHARAVAAWRSHVTGQVNEAPFAEHRTLGRIFAGDLGLGDDAGLSSVSGVATPARADVNLAFISSPDASALVERDSMRVLAWFPSSTFAVFSPDGERVIAASRIAATGGGTHEAYYVVDATRRRMLTMRMTFNEVEGIASSRDGRRFVVASGGAILRIIEAASGAESARFAVGDGHKRARVTFAGSEDQYIVAALTNTEIVRVLDATSGRVVRTLGGANWVHAVASSPDGGLVFAVDNDGALHSWNVETREHRTMHVGPASALRVHPSEPWVLLTGGFRTEALLVDYRAMSFVRRWPQLDNSRAAFSAAREVLLVRNDAIVRGDARSSRERVVTRLASDPAAWFRNVGDTRTVVAFRSHVELRDRERGEVLRRWEVPARNATVDRVGTTLVLVEPRRLLLVRIADGVESSVPIDLGFTVQLVNCVERRILLAGLPIDDPTGRRPTSPDASWVVLDRADHHQVASGTFPVATTPLTRDATYAGTVFGTLSAGETRIALSSRWQDGFGVAATTSSVLVIADLEGARATRSIETTRPVLSFSFGADDAVDLFDSGWVRRVAVATGTVGAATLAPTTQFGLNVARSANALELLDGRGRPAVSVFRVDGVVDVKFDAERRRVETLGRSGRIDSHEVP